MKKKFGVVLLALAVGLSFISSAVMAAPIVYQSTGSITIHKFDNTGTHVPEVNPDGQEISDTSLFGDPLPNIPFRISQLPSTVDLSTVNTTSAAAIVATEDYDTNGLHQSSGTTNALGVLAFTSLPLGAYLVEEQPSSGIAQVHKPFLVYLPLTYTDSDGDQNLLFDVHVYPKNQPLFVNKSVNGTSTDFNVGDTVTWNIDFGIPADIGELDLGDGGYFYIEDPLDSRLDYGNATVYFMEESAGSLIVADTLTSGTDYALTAPTSTDRTLTVAFNTQAMIDKLKDAVASGYQLRVVVTTTINKTAAEDLGSPIPNTAKLYYKKDSGDPGGTTEPPEPEIPEVTVTGLSVYKTGADTGDPLEDAVFELEWRANDAGTWAKVGEGTTDADGLIYWSFDVTQTGGASGTVVGLGQFRVKETGAPSGYQLMSGYSGVITLDSTTTPPRLSGTWKIENIKLNPGEGGFVLPTTGGNGMLLYILGGSILILCSGGLVFGIQKSKKKKR